MERGCLLNTSVYQNRGAYWQNRFEGGSHQRGGAYWKERAKSNHPMIPYIPNQGEVHQHSPVCFLLQAAMRGKNFCHAKTWKSRSKSRSYKLSGRSRGSRIHTVFLLWACLHKGGGLQIGEVICLPMLIKQPAFKNNLTTPGEPEVRFLARLLARDSQPQFPASPQGTFGTMMQFW